MLEVILLIIYACLLTILLVYCFLELGLVRNYLKTRKEKKSLPPQNKSKNTADVDLPFVTIQLPVFNEMYVVERLIDKVMEFNYPKDLFEVQVLDDSTDETLEISRNKVKEYQAKGFAIELLHRTDRTGFKAGALQKGMQKARGKFIAIFDADFLPDPNFLRDTLPHFKDPKIGVVQTRWAHLNRNYSLLTKIQAFFLDAHFTVEQAGRNSHGYFINFNGTAGIWRKETIIDGGGWQADTLTEDLDLSYRAQLKGWEFIYLEEVTSPAELPINMPAFKSQQFRWIKGGAETARKNLPKVARSSFPLPVKYHAFTHLLSSSIYLPVFMLVSLSIPLLLVKNSYIEYDYVHFGMPFLLTNVFIIIFFWVAHLDRFKEGRSKKEFFWLLPAFLTITMGLSLHNALAAARGLIRQKTPFIRTPKFNVLTGQKAKKKNKYTIAKIGPVTILEGLFALCFFLAICYSIKNLIFFLLPLHLMAFIGFAYVFLASLSHSIAKN